MSKRILSIWCLLGLAVFSDQRSTPADDSYVAAAVEYQVSADVEQNLQNYVQLIKEAAEQNADIIVFPELTLTRGSRSVNVPMYDLLKTQPIPALLPLAYDELLVGISTAARNHQIYVLINVQEFMDCNTVPEGSEEYCPEKKEYLFNTNVIFDRNGAVIDRYRKINLFGEFSRTPALKPDLGLFTTDFGVTFGHYICFDLMFQVPAIQVVEKNQITDVLFSTMWFSEMPYLSAVQIQEAYAYAENVNFIGAGANNVRVGSAGSGIYSGKAGALVSTMPGLPTTRLLVSRVPKVPGNVTGMSYPGPIYDNPADHDSLVLITDPSLPDHISRPLVNGFQEFTLVDKDVSCRFRVRLNQREGVQVEHYHYRAAVFDGERSFSGLGEGDTRICSVIACTGDTMHTCGKRFPLYKQNATSLFEELSIVATVPTPVVVPQLNAKDSAFFPVSLDVSIMPLEVDEYTYTEVQNNENTVFTFTLVNTGKDLYTFAVFGRVYSTGASIVPVLSKSLFYMIAALTMKLLLL
ncbi:vanin-like protein 2 isoform X3 [Choristoneura fumiferana]|uniref:vanin-like protein 2 isoform X3 n=1 Tax=Choristoneura fumiferana TaxID=7141 RepID=UPI003D15A54F